VSRGPVHHTEPGAANRAPARTHAAEAPTTDVFAIGLVRRSSSQAAPVRKAGAAKTSCRMEFVAQAYLRCLLDERAQPARLYPLLAVAAVPLVACISTNSAAGGEHTNVFVNCFCSDAVRGELCTTLKQKVGALSGYRLADQPLGAGVGVHLACRDTGAEVKGAQSAVSVAYARSYASAYLESALSQAEPGETDYLTVVSGGRREQVHVNLPR
jgi:hypothetical protein